MLEKLLDQCDNINCYCTCHNGEEFLILENIKSFLKSKFNIPISEMNERMSITYNCKSEAGINFEFHLDDCCITWKLCSLLKDNGYSIKYLSSYDGYHYGEWEESEYKQENLAYCKC